MRIPGNFPSPKPQCVQMRGSYMVCDDLFQPRCRISRIISCHGKSPSCPPIYSTMSNEPRAIDWILAFVECFYILVWWQFILLLLEFLVSSYYLSGFSNNLDFNLWCSHIHVYQVWLGFRNYNNGISDILCVCFSSCYSCSFGNL